MRRLMMAAVLGLMLMTKASGWACPEDGSGSYFTGNTRVSAAGYLMYEYKCYYYGHLFWARA